MKRRNQVATVKSVASRSCSSRLAEVSTFLSSGVNTVEPRRGLAESLELEEFIEGLESTVQEFKLEDEEAEKSTKYLGSGRWEYRNSYIEGMWVMPSASTSSWR